ncbi:MAG: hypothetical protein KDC53_10880, partial [Saprospiraceae bacterium]|nr:hypothetical protein [Saprospiraceae bacterium]
KYGQIYWKHNDEKATTQESVYDVSKDLLRHASKTFFNVYPTVKQKKDKKPKKEKKKKEIQIRGRE